MNNQLKYTLPVLLFIVVILLDAVPMYARNTLPQLPFRSTSVYRTSKPYRPVSPAYDATPRTDCRDLLPATHFSPSPLHVSSRATVHSYGGGSYMLEPKNHLAGSAPSLNERVTSVVSRVTSSITGMAQQQLSQSTITQQPLRAFLPNSDNAPTATIGGPRKIGEVVMGNQLFDEDGNLIGTIGSDGTVTDNNGHIIGRIDPITGTFISQGEPLDNPVGEPTCLLLFALMYALFCRIKQLKLSLRHE